MDDSQKMFPQLSRCSFNIETVRRLFSSVSGSQSPEDFAGRDERMWPLKSKSRPRRLSLPVTLHARYDAAQTTQENLRHWAMADGLSADAAAAFGEGYFIGQLGTSVTEGVSGYTDPDTTLSFGENDLAFTVGQGQGNKARIGISVVLSREETQEISMALSGSSEGFEGITADGNAFSAEMEKQFGSIYDITLPVFLSACKNPRAVFQAKSYDVIYNRDVAIADHGQYYHSGSITLSPYTRYYLIVQINGKWYARFANVWGNAVYGFLSAFPAL
jgi:hypothetical protein